MLRPHRQALQPCVVRVKAGKAAPGGSTAPSDHLQMFGTEITLAELRRHDGVQLPSVGPS